MANEPNNQEIIMIVTTCKTLATLLSYCSAASTYDAFEQLSSDEQKIIRWFATH